MFGARGIKRMRDPEQENDVQNKTRKLFSPTATSAQMQQFRTYYEAHFPASLLVRWLGYLWENSASNAVLPGTYMSRRELTFTFWKSGNPNDSIYVRFQSVENAEGLHELIEYYRPVKIDIGAVYNTLSSDKEQAGLFRAMERELVIDIDMNDYDEIRHCPCKGGKSVCSWCWPLMTLAIRVLDVALREDFGFKHLLWVFSGRRGIHCWVCDKKARRLNTTTRSAIASQISFVDSSSNVGKRVSLAEPLLPCVRRIKELVEGAFVDIILVRQQYFANDERWEELMNKLGPPLKVRHGINKARENNRTDPEGVWEAVQNLYASMDELREADLLELAFEYTYPRLDENVTRGLTHLLKSPFCVHPSTGRVCVPIDPEFCDLFDPSDVPTHETVQGDVSLLQPHFDFFERFVDEMEGACGQQSQDPIDWAEAF